MSELVAPGLSNWVRAMVFLLFTIGGWEGALIPTGEIREPTRTIPFGLTVGLLACAVTYMLLQFVTVVTIGTRMTDAPLPEVASILLGRSGAAFVTITALVSIYGWISGAILYSPRLVYALAAQGDFPAVFARLHSRFHTPGAAIILYAFTAWVLASSGTFLGIVALCSGFMTVYYAATCATLIPLRKLRPDADNLKISLGPLLSVLGVVISLALMTGLKTSELLLMCFTAVIATTNWLWAKRRHRESKEKMEAVAR